MRVPAIADLQPVCAYVRRFEAEEKAQAWDRVATEKDSTALRRLVIK